MLTPIIESGATRVIKIKSSDHNVTEEAWRRPGGWVPNELNSNLKITKVLKNYYHRQHHDHCLIKSCRPLVKGHSTTPNHSTILHLSNSFPKSSMMNHHWSTSSQRYLTKPFPLQCASRVKKWQVALVKLDPWCKLTWGQVEQRSVDWYSFKYGLVLGGTRPAEDSTCGTWYWVNIRWYWLVLDLCKAPEVDPLW